MPEQYIDPNSGAAPQPGGYASAPVTDENGPTDTAVADEVTEQQDEAAEAAEEEAEAEKKASARKATKPKS